MPLPLSRRSLVAAASLMLLASCASLPPDSQAMLRKADTVMGASQLRTLAYSGSGTGASFGQAWRPGEPWPRLNYTSFSRVLDYENGAMKEEFVRTRAEPNGGGALPLMGQGEQRGNAYLRGTSAWSLNGNGPSAAPVAVDGRIHDLWTSPHGLIKAAMRNGAATWQEDEWTVVSFAEPNRFRVRAWINAKGLVERVESVHPNAVLGDTAVSTTYSDYRSFGGVMFPGRIRQSQGGHPVLDLRVTQVQPNVPAGFEVPAPVSSFAERVVPEKAADGVWFLGGGSHNSVLVEMADHLILVESPLDDGRAQAVLTAAKQLVPNKPIRYVVASHHHFDHAGGLRAAAAEGATLVTSELARPWFQQVMANPNAVAPDALARSGKRVRVEGVVGRRVFSDGQRTLELHAIDGSLHAQGFMLAWLPRERLLVEADAFTPGTPGTPGTPPPAQPDPNNVNLVQNIERLGLNVDRILPLHGRVVPMSELLAAVGRRS